MLVETRSEHSLPSLPSFPTASLLQREEVLAMAMCQHPRVFRPWLAVLAALALACAAVGAEQQPPGRLLALTLRLWVSSPPRLREGLQVRPGGRVGGLLAALWRPGRRSSRAPALPERLPNACCRGPQA